MFMMFICINASDATPVEIATVFTATKGPIKNRQKNRVFNENNLKFACVNPLLVVTGDSLTTIQTILDIQVTGLPDMAEGLAQLVRIISRWWFVKHCSEQVTWGHWQTRRRLEMNNRTNLDMLL